ncbi:MAG: metal ABC transporter ATP-binding protein [Lachnospiraceae bacterium]|nr:metal ABC transporter ATP-binding protein [Lachnospiraceae bacterium]
MAVLKCENVTMSYEGVSVFENLNFEINSGDYLCIVGENGSGKSTLMKGLLGLRRPARGRIIYGDGLMQNQIGYLPQQSAVQRDFPASVYEVVLSGTLNSRGMRPFYSKKEKQLANRNMERLSITHLKKRCYRELSGGQQQRVLLARALCATKSLLLLDEPVTGLDPVVSGELYALISDINKSDNITVIMVSHDITESVKNASHILHIESKRCFFGSIQEYLTSSVSNVFIGE